MIHTVKGSDVVNIAEVKGFLELLACSVVYWLLAICVGSDGKETASSAEDPVSIPGQEDPLEMGMAAHWSILA